MVDNNRNVVLVDEKGNQVGLVGIWQAHIGKGVKHRAISVLLHDGEGRVLLQKRSEKKPLWPMFWSNTVCTHPFDGESDIDCAVRRLGEEMGIEMKKDELGEVYKLSYEAKYNDELSENEVTMVIVGKYEGGVGLNPEEVAESRWVGWEELNKEIEEKPGEFTPWFGMILRNKEVEKVVNE